MPKPEKIPELQLERVRRLERIIEKCSTNGNLKKAKLAIDDLKPILTRFSQRARLLKSYLILYEGALESWELDLAKRGFEFVRKEANKETRLYLEATFLLAIAHLREQDLFSAEPLIFEVINNEKFVPSKNQRKLFINEVIDRLDQEGAIVALARTYQESISEEELHTKSLKLLKQDLTLEELEAKLGESLPQHVKDFIFRVDQLSRKQLPPGDKFLLPPAHNTIKNKKVGNLLFKAVKKRLYKYLCDETSDVYQIWIHKGLNAIVSESYIASAVIAALTDLRLGVGAFAVYIASIAMKEGLHNFCNNNKPQSFMSLRNRKK